VLNKEENSLNKNSINSNKKTAEMTNKNDSGSNSPITEQQLLVTKLKDNQVQDDEINFVELWRTIWAGKLTIISISIVFAVISIFYALSKPNIYRASVILTSASSEGSSGGLGALAGQFGGLASMAGINLGSGGNDKTKLALEIIKTRSFLESFISKHNLLVPIMAATNWDISTNSLVFNDEVYDHVNQKWVREVKAPKTPEPSLWEAYNKFSEFLFISQEKKSSIILIDIEYLSPTLAQQWLSWLIEDLNALMRQQEIDETKASISYLKKELEGIEFAAMEAVFYQLIEEQTKNLMLINAKPEYVLKTIDPAQVPEIKAKPKRGLIVFLGIILGMMLSTLIVLIRKNKQPQIV